MLKRIMHATQLKVCFVLFKSLCRDIAQPLQDCLSVAMISSFDSSPVNFLRSNWYHKFLGWKGGWFGNLIGDCFDPVGNFPMALHTLMETLPTPLSAVWQIIGWDFQCSASSCYFWSSFTVSRYMVNVIMTRLIRWKDGNIIQINAAETVWTIEWKKWSTQTVYSIVRRRANIHTGLHERVCVFELEKVLIPTEDIYKNLHGCRFWITYNVESYSSTRVPRNRHRNQWGYIW